MFPSGTDADGGWILTKNTRCAEVLASALGGRLVDHRRADARTLAFPGDPLVRDQGDRHRPKRLAAVYGGIVDHPSHAQKSLLHELAPRASSAGDGYRPDLAAECRDAVLPGYTAFCAADVGHAVAAVQGDFGRRVRLKDGAGTRGQGQVVIESIDDVSRTLPLFPRLASDGVVVEPDLDAVARLTVSFVSLGGTRDFVLIGEPRTVWARSRERYAGIDLTCVRGGPEDLTRLTGASGVRAVRQAERVHAAYDVLGAKVGKGTYDVLEGVTSNGRRVSGVSDPSLRPTASTPAEVVALSALSRDRRGATVRARMRCTYDGRPDGRLGRPDLVIHAPPVTIAVALSSC